VKPSLDYVRAENASTVKDPSPVSVRTDRREMWTPMLVRTATNVRTTESATTDVVSTPTELSTAAATEDTFPVQTENYVLVSSQNDGWKILWMHFEETCNGNVCVITRCSPRKLLHRNPVGGKVSETTSSDPDETSLLLR